MTRYKKTNRQIREPSPNTAASSENRDFGTVLSDGIICLIDGKKRRNLRKWLVLQHGIAPDEYRRLYNLPDDYPMTVEEKAPTTGAKVVTFPKPRLIAKPQVA